MSLLRVLTGLLALSAVCACGLIVSDEERIGLATDSMRAGDYRAAEVHLKTVLNSDGNNLQVRLMLAEVHRGLNDLLTATKEIERAAEMGAAPEDYRPLQLRIMAGLGQYAEMLQILADDPAGLSESELLRFRGEALLGINDGAAAEQQFAKWLQLQPGSVDARVSHAKARAIQGDIDSAREALNLVIEQDPQHTDALLALGVLHYGQGNFVAAKSAYSQAVETSQPQTDLQRYVFALVGMADSALMLRDTESARATIELLKQYTPSAPHTLLQEARLAQMDHDDQAAQRALQELVLVSPDNVNALMLLGSVQWRLGHFQQAEVQLSRAVALAPDNLQARKMWAMIQLRRSNTLQAVEILQPLLDSHSDDAELNGMLAIADLQRGRSDSALDTLLMTAQRYPDNLDIKLQLAEGYRFTGDPQRAIDILQEIEPGEDNDYRRERILIAAYSDLEQPDKALDIAEQFVASGATDTGMLNYVAQTFVAAGDAARGRAILQRANEIAPKDIETLLSLAVLEEREGRLDAAHGYYEAALSSDPESLQATLGLANLAMAAGDSEAASAYLARARSQDPDDVRMRLTLAIGHLNNGRHRNARTLAREVASIGSEDALVSQTVGRVLLETGAIEEARAQFELANRQSPDSVDILLGLAQSLMAQGDTATAYGFLQRAVSLDPASAAANSVMALAELRLGETEKASDRMQRVRELQPDNVSAMVVEGELQFELGNFGAAVAAFRRAGELGAGEHAAIREFETRLRWQGQDDPTQPLLEWIDRNPNDSRARTMLAQHYSRNGLTEKAVRLYEGLLKTEANDPVILNNLAWEYQQAGDLDTALALALKARDLQPKSAAIADTLGWIYRGLGRYEMSEKFLREAVKRAPDNAEIRYHLAVALAESGVAGEATRILADIINSGQNFASRSAALELQAELLQVGDI
ncbi:MAG: PEP-CTERM system TPR-repeat protein PrsT [Gammaproteobacteria bacterium]|nr:PEP-CTERM system TPR-repeat protein PrsT [Gammaproteobacteria bacterium]